VQEGIEQGIQQGIQEGIQKGIAQGEALVLMRQMRQRFGELPYWAEERLARAGRNDLEQWAERILEARTLEEIFD
jgi:flagellar biosynthesis/type III secretory pathway protein FliH